MPAFLPSVDRAGFAVALGLRLRSRGVTVGPTEIGDLVAGLHVAFPRDRAGLYWLARVTLVSKQPDLPVFDRVFAEVFDDAVLPMDPNARRQPSDLPPSAGRPSDRSLPASADDAGSTLPWVTLRDVQATDDSADGHSIPELAPSGLEALADVPLAELDPAQLAVLTEALGRTAWPTRRRRRTRPDPHRGRIDLRRTLAQARRTGFEPLHLRTESPVVRPRRVVLVCDLSQSMQAEASALLHLMRALVLQRDAEVFAFSTRLHRLTAELRERSPERAIEQACARVADRYGGTRIAASLRTLMESRHGNLLRGSIVLVASDGWDSAPPEEMAVVMRRLRRRAHRVYWLNPRAGAPGFTPTVAAMAAALPYVDRLLPADTYAALSSAIATIAELSTRPFPANFPGSKLLR